MHQKQYHYIYLIVNTLNGKKYIGKRSSKKPPHLDNYMGSGTAIRKAMSEYGKVNFEKFILEECEDKEQLCKMEQLYINVLYAVIRNDYYNLLKA